MSSEVNQTLKREPSLGGFSKIPSFSESDKLKKQLIIVTIVTSILFIAGVLLASGLFGKIGFYLVLQHVGTGTAVVTGFTAILTTSAAIQIHRKQFKENRAPNIQSDFNFKKAEADSL